MQKHEGRGLVEAYFTMLNFLCIRVCLLFVAEDLLWWDFGVTLMLLFSLHLVRQIFNSWVCAILSKVIYDVEVTNDVMRRN